MTQAWFEVRNNDGKVMMVGVQTPITVDGDEFAFRFEEAIVEELGRVMSVKFICIAERLSYGHSAMDSAIRMIGDVL